VSFFRLWIVRKGEDDTAPPAEKRKIIEFQGIDERIYDTLMNNLILFRFNNDLFNKYYFIFDLTYNRIKISLYKM